MIPTDDMSRVRLIVTQPDIWERFSDGEDMENYWPINDSSNQWLIVQDENEIGVIYLKTETNCAVSFHPYLYKKHRYKAREMMKAFYRWLLHAPDVIEKINVAIPECFKSVINAAKKTGFTEEGRSRSSYRKDGVMYDRVMLGITRQEAVWEV